MQLKVKLSDTLGHGYYLYNIFKRECKYIYKFRDGTKQSYIFGSYQNGPIKNVNVFQGDLTGFLFSI